MSTFIVGANANTYCKLIIAIFIYRYIFVDNTVHGRTCIAQPSTVVETVSIHLLLVGNPRPMPGLNLIFRHRTSRGSGPRSVLRRCRHGSFQVGNREVGCHPLKERRELGNGRRSQRRGRQQGLTQPCQMPAKRPRRRK
jgi:hypothetical protein